MSIIGEVGELIEDGSRYLWFWPADLIRAIKYSQHAKHRPGSWWARSWSG